MEERKWRGVAVWSHPGILCTGESYKNVVKLTFAKGASLEDPAGLFNASLDGNHRRAIDLHEGDKIDENALKALIRAAVAQNTSVQKSGLGRRRSRLKRRIDSVSTRAHRLRAARRSRESAWPATQRVSPIRMTQTHESPAKTRRFSSSVLYATTWTCGETSLRSDRDRFGIGS